MPDPAAATETQLRNIQATTGMTIPQFASAAAARGIEGHAQIIAFVKSEYGLTYGNANLVALKVRELAAGGPAAPDALLDAQYAGAKAPLRPIYERLAQIAADLGPDVQTVVQKTGVAFRRKKLFAMAQAPSAKRIDLGLNLAATPDDPRVEPTTGMCNHRVQVGDVDAVDAHVAAWLRTAYDEAG